MSKEEFLEDDDQYIDEDNDPYAVKEVTEENSVAIEEQEHVVSDEKIVAFVKKGRSDAAMQNHDHMMEEKVLDSLRRGKLK